MQLRKPPQSTPRLYEQDGKGDNALVYAHYFVAQADWYVTEYEPATGLMFGWAELQPGCGELGYFNYVDLATLRVAGVFPVDYEIGWVPRTLHDVLGNRKALQ